MYGQKEELRRDRERKFDNKMQLIERMKRTKRRRLMLAVEEMRRKDKQHLETLRQNVETLAAERSEKNAQVLFAATAPPSQMRSCYSGSRPQTAAESLRAQLSTAQSISSQKLEDRKRKLSEKMVAFDRRMEEREEKLRSEKEEREEQARLWRLTMKLNQKKKERKERYRREQLEQRLASVEKKQKLVEQHRSAAMTERFYTKISGEMKNFCVQEALHDMAETKRWSLTRVDRIMDAFKPKLQTAATAKSEKAIRRNISKVLSNPLQHPRNPRLLDHRT